MTSLFKPGDIVRMNETVRDHDIVKYRDYVVQEVTGTSILIEDPVNNRSFGWRRGDCFHIEGGPW